MTKKYILTKDQIEDTVITSEFPASSTAVKTELDKKVAIAQGTENKNKFLKVGTDGNVTLGVPDAQVQANWNETDSTAASYIQNKPFKTIGTGLSVVADALTADIQFKFQIFTTLPTAGAEYAQTIALIAHTGEGQNVYDEYGCVQVEGTWKWERFGTTDFQLNIVQNASGITINNTALQSASSSQKGLLTAADWSTFNGKQNALTFDDSPKASSSNPVKSGGVYTELGKKVDKVSGSSLVPDTKVSAYDSHIADTTKHITASERTTWNGKQSAITSTNKLGADLVDDTDATHKFVSASDITGWNSHVSNKSNPHSVTKAQVGLGNVDNTSDANKPISTATQTALNGKVDEVEGVVALGKDSTGYYFNE